MCDLALHKASQSSTKCIIKQSFLPDFRSLLYKDCATTNTITVDFLHTENNCIAWNSILVSQAWLNELIWDCSKVELTHGKCAPASVSKNNHNSFSNKIFIWILEVYHAKMMELHIQYITLRNITLHPKAYWLTNHGLWTTLVRW